MRATPSIEDLLAPDAGPRTGFHRSLLHCWAKENLPVTGTGWLPYPCSLRISNWIKWHLSGGELDDELARSLAMQADGWTSAASITFVAITSS